MRLGKKRSRPVLGASRIQAPALPLSYIPKNGGDDGNRTRDRALTRVDFMRLASANFNGA